MELQNSDCRIQIGIQQVICNHPAINLKSEFCNLNSRDAVMRLRSLLGCVALVAASTSIALMQSPSPPSSPSGETAGNPGNPGNPGNTVKLETAWVCPMHPDYTMDIAGKCPRCGMALVRAAPFDVRDYRLDFQTVPAVVKPGLKTTLRFRIYHPGTGEAIKKFEIVHERQYHLFLISQDMEYFQHIHPVEA